MEQIFQPVAFRNMQISAKHMAGCNILLLAQVNTIIWALQQRALVLLGQSKNRMKN